MSVTKVTVTKGTIMSKIQAAKYAEQNHAVRRVSLHERMRTMCLPNPIRPMPYARLDQARSLLTLQMLTIVIYKRSILARSLSGENSSSSAMFMSKPPGGAVGISLTWYICYSLSVPDCRVVVTPSLTLLKRRTNSHRSSLPRPPTSGFATSSFGSFHPRSTTSSP